MWNRADLKDKAKGFLKKYYWKAFLVALVIAIVTSGGSGSNNNKGIQYKLDSSMWNQETISESVDSISDSVGAIETSIDRGVSRMMPLALGLLIGLGGLFIFIGAMMALAFKIFVGAPLEVGGRSFFYKGALTDDEVHYAHLGMAFRKEHYTNIVWAMLYRGIMNFLFFLLLVIPGIVKHYAYSMVPYLLADNPNMNAREALKLSERMTSGHKLDILILDLSFIGWYILGSLLFGIGIYFVNPYVYATKAQLYISLKESAITAGFFDAKGLVGIEEF
ncbi:MULTISPECIES: DUF975 family protein [unclassified Fusibacter]|uniref:DUF975 family protein n=1 Tax=unclassified Fusibacter TaxID=2624464 RepID=UPI001010A5F6|nr:MULTISPECIES: DUF975 family protein [unclassified Fusibacter]MCK8061173.1 DUF975 family protein [Fusibacter sp. A2]NPE23290.1 DUF975 family protein [Fusibacter sp. A1]RXV59332.1 DUF975 family protein [Fusibacter sp. A1]